MVTRLPFIFIAVVMCFVLIRPQRRRGKEQPSWVEHAMR